MSSKGLPDADTSWLPSTGPPGCSCFTNRGDFSTCQIHETALIEDASKAQQKSKATAKKARQCANKKEPDK